MAYERQIVRQSNAYITGKSPNPAIAACTLHWLNSWAEGGALLGDVTTQGEYIRKWALGTIASAYVQIKTEPSLDKTEKKRVEKWIEKLAYEVVVDYTRRPELRSRRNNHLYWAAWAVGISSVATQNHNLFDWSMEKARFGIDQIEEDGTLPLETYRQTLALQYHMFALIPLVYLSELGMRNGVNLYDENDARIHRLIKRILASAEDPSYIEKKSGSTQNMQKILTNAQLVWLAPYSARFPENETKRIRRLQKKFDSPDLPRTGGDSELLFPPTP